MTRSVSQHPQSDAHRAPDPVASQSRPASRRFKAVGDRIRDLIGGEKRDDEPVAGRNEAVPDLRVEAPERVHAAGAATPAQDDVAPPSMPTPRARPFGMVRSSAGSFQDAPDASMREPDDLRRVEHKLTALFDAIDREPDDLAPGSRQDRFPHGGSAEAVVATEPTLARNDLVPEVQPSGLDRAVAEIMERQAALDQSSGPPPRPAGPDGAEGAFSIQASRAAAAELMKQFGPLSGRAVTDDRFENRPAAAQPPQAERDDADSALDIALRTLKAQIAAARDGGMGTAVLAPLERVAFGITGLDAMAARAALDLEIRTLGGRIEAMLAQGLNVVALQRVQIQARTMRDLLVASGSRAAPGLPDAADLARSGGGEMAAPARGPEPASMEEVHALLVSLRAGDGVKRIERRLEDLAGKVDAAVGDRREADAVDQLTKRIDAVHATMVERLPGRAPAIDTAPIEAMIGGLASRIDGLGRSAVETRTLEAMMSRLAAKLDEASQPSAGTAVFKELQAQIGTLAARIDRSDAGLTAIVSVERSVGELFSQLAQTRDAALDAVDGAARLAARDTLRAAMLGSTLPFQPPAGSADASAEQITRELSSLRAGREAADAGLHAVLAAVGQKLDGLASGLALLGERERAVPRESAPAASGAAAPQFDVPILDLAEVAAPSHDWLASRLPHRGTPLSREDASEADLPIEPGSGALRSGFAVPNPTRPAPDVRADPAHFIAVARRAAQAASQTAAESLPDRALPGSKPVHKAAKRGRSLAARAKSFATSRRRSILLSLAGTVLLLATAQVGHLAVTRWAIPGFGGSQSAAVTLPAATTVAVAKPEVQAGTTPAPVVAAAPALATVTGTTDPTPTGTVSAPALPSLAMGALPGRPKSAADPAPAVDTSGMLQRLAQDGDAAAQYELGQRYAAGRGLARDLAAASQWYEKAAKQGLMPAAYSLASLYEKGLGVTRDPVQAMAWYGRAADAGNIRAMHNLAVMLAEGAGGTSDYAGAGRWFGKASRAGIRDSQFNLAILYARGLGVERSLPQSFTWFAIAAAQGDTDAARKRDEVAAKLDSASLASARAEADAFRPATPISAANEVAPPPGGWDAAEPSRPAVNPVGRFEPNARVSKN